MEFVLLILLALAIPALGVIGFFRTLSLARRIETLERGLAALEARSTFSASEGPQTLPAQPPAAEPEAAPAVEPEAAPAAEPEGEAAPEPRLDAPQPEGFDVAPPGPVRAAPQRPRSLEETIGARWAVWLGGLALALGGLFLVRYTIEQGLVGPGARIVLGTLFALALVGAGERMRRSERAAGDAIFSIPAANVPSILTAAGIVTAFGVAYAAHALYGFVGQTLGFILMAAIALAALAAAALHGPALASLGLVGAFVVPLLVSSEEPRVWPVVFYLIVVAAAGYAQARLRRWLWLARAAALGAGTWGVAFIGIGDPWLACATHIVVQTALAAFFLALEPYRGQPDAQGAPDLFALTVLAAFAALAGLALQEPGLGAVRPVLGGFAFAVQLATALAVAPASGAAILAAAVACATLWGWPVLAESAAESPTVLPGGPSRPPMPDALWLFLTMGAVAGSALGALGWTRLMRSPSLPALASGLIAAAATAGPLALLVVAWRRVSGFDASIPFALVAGLLALGAVTAARLLRDHAQEGGAAARVGLEAFAAGAIAALAIGLTMILDKGALTVALALAALGAAWVTTREPVGSLRYAVAALGAIVAGRLAWNTMLVAGDVGSVPVFNWLLWAYGVPALAFGFAARLLRRQKDDQVVALCEALTLALSGLLVFLEIRHALTGSLRSPRTDHLEVGLQVFAALLFAIVLVSLEAFRRSAALRIGSYVFGGAALAGGLLGLLILENPAFGGGKVMGGAVFNSILAAYLLPSLAAFALARRARGRRPWWFEACASALAFGLQFLWLVLEVRTLFQGADIGVLRRTSPGELYAYSAAFLAVGLGLLAYGVLRRSTTARLASAAYILLAAVKAFLVDMSGLEGPLRALSFIGLGLALVGIGLVYQRWVFGRADRGGRDAGPAPAS
ncbi:DUF2339 domain-containing protein [Alsobacter sp. SYSU BS001988]